jgi:hypothetical protein
VFNRTDRGRHRGRDAMALEALIILVIVGAIAGCSLVLSSKGSIWRLYRSPLNFLVFWKRAITLVYS